MNKTLFVVSIFKRQMLKFSRIVYIIPQKYYLKVFINLEFIKYQIWYTFPQCAHKLLWELLLKVMYSRYKKLKFNNRGKLVFGNYGNKNIFKYIFWDFKQNSDSKLIFLEQKYFFIQYKTAEQDKAR